MQKTQDKEKNADVPGREISEDIEDKVAVMDVFIAMRSSRVVKN